MLKQVNYSDFNYIQKQPERQRICFGSGKPRITEFAAIDGKNRCNIGPSSYDVKFQCCKVSSKRGSPGIANLSKRLPLSTGPATPDPGKYSVIKHRPLIESLAPFNSSEARTMTFLKGPKNPGPQTYNIQSIDKCKRTRFDYNFGKPCAVPALETICINYPSNECVKCGESFDQGDFWQRNYQDYLCASCMEEEHRIHEVFTEKQLRLFKNIRTCAFMHRHEGTSAAIRIMTKKKIAKKLQLENYLSLYLKCFG